MLNIVVLQEVKRMANLKLSGAADTQLRVSIMDIMIVGMDILQENMVVQC